MSYATDVNVLAEASQAIEEAMDVIKRLQAEDTFDHVYRGAYRALEDGQDHLAYALSHLTSTVKGE
jgi:hypothetical protein